MEFRECTLEQYREIVRDLPRPTDEQIVDFVRFVSEAHSWYKHLPLRLPGLPFVFYVDPCAGMAWPCGRDGPPVERVEGDKPFHYTWMTTRNYRARFGHLDYGPAEWAEFGLQTGERLRLPLEIRQAGRVDVTALVHRYAAEWFSSRQHFQWVDRDETSGDEREDEMMRKIRARLDSGEARVTCEDTGARVVPGLLELLAPERARIQAGMVTAIHEAVRLVYGRAA